MASESTEFVRRKFTITTDLDSELEEMAAQHYQGNVSLCLRQAIVDHRETLNGNGQVTLKRLTRTVRQIQDDIEDLERATETVREYVQNRNRATPVMQAEPAESESVPSAAFSQVIQVIEDGETPLRAEDIIERVELPPGLVRRTLGRLLDRSYLSRTSDAPPRYQRIGAETAAEGASPEGGHHR